MNSSIIAIANCCYITYVDYVSIIQVVGVMNALYDEITCMKIAF